MGHKIFISYKYADDNVQKISSGFHRDTVRTYVDKLEEYINNSGNNIYKGESDDEDLSALSDDAIWNKLKDRIYDSTLTIILISPNMKKSNSERDQWIPWEISYSLKEQSRKNSAGNSVTSKTNALLAIVLPDMNNSYSYYITNNSCCSDKCRTLSTNKLFNIMCKNMFNIKKSDTKECSSGRKIYYGESSYIESIKWDDFILNPDRYIEKAYKRQNSIEQYDVCKEL